LREAGTFVGIPSGARQIARFDGSRIITLKGVSDLVDVSNPANRPRSLSAVIRSLQNLPPLTLEAERLSGTEGEEPYEVELRLNASDAIVWHTTVTFISGGHLASTELPAREGGVFRPTQLGPGVWELAVERAGIGATGMAVATKSLGQVTVRAKPGPPPPPPPPPARPSIAVQGKGDGSFVVTGLGFSPNATIHIRIVDGPFGDELFLSATSDPAGKLQSFMTGKICQRPGQLFFSANDGRADPTDLTGTLWSNTVTMSCPF
jgi:hypothetical protein